MKFLPIIVSCAALTGLTGSLLAADGGNLSGDKKSLSVTTNDVLVVQAASGAVAVIQFTSFSEYAASYRWRYRAAKAQPLTNGKGQVRESYDRKAKADGGYELTPKDDHDTIVRAGGINLDWSYGSLTNGWLYHRPSRVTIQVLSSSAFDKEL